LSTIVISSIRSVAERMRPPRALHCEFPLGLPLGMPNDTEFQQRVLDAAFALLEEPQGPVLVDFPETIQSKEADPLSCSIPPRYDPNLHPAVDEAQALRSAYDRALAKSGRSSVGKAISVDEIPAALEKFVRIVEGHPWEEVGFNDEPHLITMDIRSYYEELALELVGDGPVSPSGAMRWFFEKTEAGKVLLEARQKMKEAGAPFLIWWHMVPGSLQNGEKDLMAEAEKLEWSPEFRR
jgi:hypothetical protein